MSTTIAPHRPVRGAVLTCGYGTVLVMWALGYVALLQPGLLLGEIIVMAMVLALLAGGFAAGRFTGQGVYAGAATGAVVAMLNLLIVGGLLRSTHEADTLALWWIPLTAGLSIALAALGGALASLMGPPRSVDSPRDFHADFAALAVGAVFLLLITGGIVTGTETGLAVPDWPNSFGHNMLLYPLTEMVVDENRAVGVHLEHAHRLYGMLVGLTMILLVVNVFLTDRRAWLRGVTGAVFVMVCVQGLMGGLRVTETNLTLAMIHGMFAQIIFAAVVVIAAARSARWRFGAGPVVDPGAGMDRRLPLVLIVMLLLQLGFGAAYRHLSAAESTANPALVTGLLHTHLAFAFIGVLPAALFAGLRAWGLRREHPPLRIAGLGLLHLIAFQIVLGFAAFLLVLRHREAEVIPWYEVVVTTAHQATGAVLLALAALLAAWSRRLLV